jgi:hypothetical protein
MKAVILSINRNAIIVDITHEIPKYSIRTGAFTLASAAPYFPKGTVHLAVVDPGVGSRRKPMIVETEKSLYVGPDNGLLMLAAKAEGICRVFEIAQKKFLRDTLSNTFHGRDIFSPIAAHLSKGVSPSKVGRILKNYHQPLFLNARIRDNVIDCEVLHIDSFGNIVTNIRSKDLTQAGIGVGSRLEYMNRKFTFFQTYSDVSKGSLLGLVGSHGFFEVAANQRNAARLLRLNVESRLRLTFTC